MDKTQRLIVFVLIFLFTLLLYFILPVPVDAEIQILLFSTLVVLSFAVWMVEHFFTKPTDVLANTISILLILLTSISLNLQMGFWYWILFGWSALAFVCAALALVLLDKNRRSNSLKNRVSRWLMYIANHMGNGKVLYFALFFLTLLFFVDLQHWVFLFLFAYAFIILIVDPKGLIASLFSSSPKSLDSVGEIFAVHSENMYLVRLHNDIDLPGKFDVLLLKYPMQSTAPLQKGVVVDRYFLNDQAWVKVLAIEDVSLDDLETTIGIEDNMAYQREGLEATEFINQFVGVVLEDSNIQAVRFEYNSTQEIEEGDLLEVKVGENRIFYQVANGTTKIEPLDKKDESGVIVAVAAQLGIWSEDRQTFDKFGWVPSMNTPVMRVKDVPEVSKRENECQIGKLPGTEIPIFFDMGDGIDHHVAILGVTGSGKSVFAREVIRDVVRDGTKAICIDFTGEYQDKFPDHNPAGLVDQNLEPQLFSAINRRSDELAKFRNQQLQNVIDTAETELRNGFSTALQTFLESDASIALFELPDVSNTTSILDYTKWFFQILFETAKEHDNYENRLCIVIEEAHTVVPEWNFIGDSAKEASSLVNAISQIALQGRKYGVGFVVIAQRTANVSKTVLTQCNSVIAFQQFDNTSKDFLANYMGNQMAGVLANLKFRQAIAVGKGFRSGVPMVFEVPEIDEEAGDR